MFNLIFGICLIFLGIFISVNWFSHHIDIPLNDSGLHGLASFVVICFGSLFIKKWRNQTKTEKGWESVND